MAKIILKSVPIDSLPIIEPDNEHNWVDKVAQSNDWQTPENAIAAVHRYGPIKLDPATEEYNPTRALRFFTVKDNGLKQEWEDGWFCNPPYSKLPGDTIPPMRLWVAKMAEQFKKGYRGIALLPCGARFSTAYFQDNVLAYANAVCWVRGRLKFIDIATGEPGKGNNYDSAFWGYGVDIERFKAAFKDLGKCHALGS